MHYQSGSNVLHRTGPLFKNKIIVEVRFFVEILKFEKEGVYVCNTRTYLDQWDTHKRNPKERLVLYLLIFDIIHLVRYHNHFEMLQHPVLDDDNLIPSVKYLIFVFDMIEYDMIFERRRVLLVFHHGISFLIWTSSHRICIFRRDIIFILFLCLYCTQYDSEKNSEAHLSASSTGISTCTTLH